MFKNFLISIFIVLAVTISAYAAPTAKELGALPSISDAALSPNGNEIAVVVNKDGTHIIRVLNLSNLKDTSRMIALKPEMKPQYVKWVNDGRLIISFRQNERIGRTPIRTGYLFTLDTRTMRGNILIDPTKPEPGIKKSSDTPFRQFNNIVVDWLEDDPDHILMTFGNTNLSKDLRRVNVKTGDHKVIKRELDNVRKWVTDRRGEPRIGQGRSANSGKYVLRIRDADSEKWRDAADFPGLDPVVKIYGFTSKPNELIIGDYQGRDTLGLYIYDLDRKTISRTLYHNDDYDVSGVVTSARTGDVIGARYTADGPETEMLGDNKSTLSRMRAKFAGSNVRFVDWSENSGKTLFTVSNASDPGYLMITGKDGTPSSLGRLRPQLDTNDFGEVISVQYSARDGQKIPGFVTLPSTVTDTSQLKDLPFIILPHGGPYARDSHRFDYFAQFFATRGYGVLQMNFRGSAGYGKTFQDSGRDNWVVMQEDVEDGTRWLISKGYADPKRICIAGWSYGGYAALMGASKNSELYSCAISMAGLTDINSFIKDQKDYELGKFAGEHFLGKGFQDKDDIKANSPAKNGVDMTVPVLLAHGKKDQVVRFSQFSKMKSALKKSSAKVTYMEFKNGDHSLTNEAERQEFLEGVETFLEKYNGKSEWAK